MIGNLKKFVLERVFLRMRNEMSKVIRMLGMSLLILAVIAGCTNTKSANEPSSGSSSQSPESAKPTPETKVTFENAPVVKFMHIDYSAAQRKESKFDGTDNPYSRFIFEKTGVKMIQEYLPEEGYEQKVQLTLASPGDVDLIFLGWTAENSVNMARSGALAPINDYIGNYPNVNEVYNDEYWKSVSFDENKYLMGAMYLYPRATRATLIRQDWLDKLKLKMPTTVDELFDVAKAFKENKPDGQLTFGLTGRKGLDSFFALTAAYGNPTNGPGTPYLYLDKPKKEVVLWQTSDAGRAYFTTAQKFWKAGLVDQESFTNSSDQFWGKVNNGQVGIVSHQPVSVGWLTTSIRQTEKSKEPLLAVIPPLTGTGFKNPYGTEGAYEIGLRQSGFFGVPKGNKNIDNIMKIFNFIMSEEGSEARLFGLEGIEHDVVNGEKVLNYKKVANVSFFEDYLITGNPNQIKEGRYYEAAIKSLVQEGDAQLDPREDVFKRVMDAYATVTPTLVPNQDWPFTIPRLTEEDLYPDYLGAMQALTVKMLTGEYDAATDKGWQKYLDAVDKTGINKIIKAKETYLREKAQQLFE